MGSGAVLAATVVVTLFASACASPTGARELGAPTPAAVPSPSASVAGPRPHARGSSYWTPARLSVLREAKQAYTPPPPDAGPSDTTPTSTPASPPKNAEVVQPTATPAPPTPLPDRAVPEADEPQQRPPQQAEPSQRFTRALVGIDAQLRDGEITLQQALRRLQRMQRWQALRPVERRLLDENVRRVRAILAERARTRLGG